MGKKRIAKKGATGAAAQAGGKGGVRRLSRKKLEKGILHVQASYNNTRVLLTDATGGAVAGSSSGALGFKGAKKGTPFAAAKVGDLVGEGARQLDVKEVTVIVRGVGSGRESAIRSFLAKSGAQITRIQDRTPIPFNGPRPPKPRRV